MPQYDFLSQTRVVQPYRLVGTTFGASIDAQFWTAANSGAASAAGVANGKATLTSGTANDGYGQISSARSGRFMFVHPHLYRAAVRIPALTKEKCTRRWGAYTLTATTTPQDGFFFSLDGDDLLSVNYVNAGSVTSVSSGDFNGPILHTFTMDTNVHAYEIEYYEMAAQFYIDGIPMHHFISTTAKFAETFNHYAVATAINAADGTTSGSIELWAASILRLGRDEGAPKYIHLTTAATTVLKNSAGRLHRITINNAGGTLITVYDNTAASGTVIAVVSSLTPSPPLTLDYDVDFQTGLTIVTTGTWDLTVMYE